MGLAASQGRLLLLTARKSDLEFRAQQISQSRLVLARQQEGIAKQYADSTANTCLKVKLYDDEKGETTYEDLTWANMLKFMGGSNGGGNYKVVYSGAGKGDFPSKDDLAKLNKDKGGPNSYLKYLLDSGAISIQTKTDNKWTDTSIAGDVNFTEPLYDTDDAKSKAKYDADMLSVKVKDQQLEMEIKGIETQHKAVETEYESVQKVIQKNIEVSFKIFS